MEATKNVILVPTDFTEVADNAINQAIEAGRQLNSKIILLHVIDKNTRAKLKKENKDISVIDEQLKKIAGQKKATSSLEIDAISMEGDIFTTVSEAAKETNAALLVMGTHGKVGMQKITGSYALKVVTSSPVPVIVVQKRPFTGGFRNIVLPITSDAGPLEKTKWAAYIAKNFKSKIHILQIDSEGIDNAVDIITDFFEKQEVEFVVKKAGAGNFSKQVLDYATASNSDLIMIMTNPEKGFSKFILGSYDEEMIFNASQIPVMCINPRKFNWEKITRF